MSLDLVQAGVTERDKNEALTAYRCGTSIAMMNRHYRDTMDDEETIEEFWSLTPAKIRKEKPKVELTTKQRIDWPSKAKLKKLVWQKPLVHAAAGLSVSDVALKKHCMKLGIELPPRAGTGCDSQRTRQIHQLRLIDKSAGPEYRFFPAFVTQSVHTTAWPKSAPFPPAPPNMRWIRRH